MNRQRLSSTLINVFLSNQRLEHRYLMGKTVSALLDKVWLETPTGIRRDYGIDFFQGFKRWYGKQAERARHPSEVGIGSGRGGYDQISTN